MIWKVDFDTGSVPELCINSKIPNAIEKMRSDPHFQALVLPAALRHVLIYYLWNDTDEDDENYSKWMAFAEGLYDEKPEDGDPEALMNWVDDVVSAFSKKFNMCDRLLDTIKED